MCTTFNTHSVVFYVLSVVLCNTAKNVSLFCHHNDKKGPPGSDHCPWFSLYWVADSGRCFLFRNELYEHEKRKQTKSVPGIDSGFSYVLKNTDSSLL